MRDKYLSRLRLQVHEEEYSVHVGDADGEDERVDRTLPSRDACDEVEAFLILAEPTQLVVYSIFFQY